jgi:hypothetical protein
MIAVLVETFLTDHDDVFRALFGNTKLIVPIGQLEAATTDLARDGFWLAPKGPSNVGVSAVATAREFYEWRVAAHSPDVWSNPWADHHFPEILPWRTHSITDEGNVETFDSKIEPYELFELPPEWPGPEGPFDV